MKGIVKHVQSNGSINLKHGTFYKYEVSIQSDNELYHGEYLSKSDNQNKFVVGETVQFTYQDGEYPKIKPVTDFEYKSSFVVILVSVVLAIGVLIFIGSLNFFQTSGQNCPAPPP